MKRPSFQFYPGDWQGNAKLRRCTHAERGVWVDVMCLMHDSEEYGVLRWPLADIAQAVGCKPTELKSIERKGVLKGVDSGSLEPFIFTPRHAGKDGEPVTLIPKQDGPIWYSSRMVRDEYIRQKRGEGSRFGAEPNGTPKVGNGDCLGMGQGDGPSSSSSSSSSKSKAEAPATRLPKDWVLPDEWRGWARTEKGWTSLEAEQVSAQFKDYWIAKPGKDGKKLDWFATWRMWCRNQRGVQEQSSSKTVQGLKLLENMKG